jgi:hypothetical protein
MVSHTRADIDEINNRRLVALFTAMHVAARNETTTHAKVVANLAYWRSLPRLDRSLLFELMRDQPITPSASCRATHPRDGDKAGRPGGDLNTESRPAGQL